jgi:hypothetical protein
VDALPLQEESALSQPPEPEAAIAAVCSADVGEQRGVRLHGPDHATPNSLRTIATPWTMLASFCRAAQRAV